MGSIVASQLEYRVAELGQYEILQNRYSLCRKLMPCRKQYCPTYQEQGYDQERDTHGQEQDVWDTEYQDQEDGTQDEYEARWDKMMEQEEAECNMTHQSSQDSDDQDEDDQDAYE